MNPAHLFCKSDFVPLRGFRDETISSSWLFLLSNVLASFLLRFFNLRKSRACNGKKIYRLRVAEIARRVYEYIENENINAKLILRESAVPLFCSRWLLRFFCIAVHWKLERNWKHSRICCWKSIYANDCCIINNTHIHVKYDNYIMLYYHNSCDLKFLKKY